MSRFLFLIAIFALLGQGQGIDCTNKYYTVNTYQRGRNSFSFSCYGVGSDCNIYYVPPETGCTGDSSLLEFVGTVPENETKVLTSNDTLFFELGGGFCSNNQIGVYFFDNFGRRVRAHLPRSTESGTKFIIPTPIDTTLEQYSCLISALSLPANVTIDMNDGSISSMRSITPFGFTIFDFQNTLSNDSPAVTMINSDNPIIVSCTKDVADLVNFQPISSEPLLLTALPKQYVLVAISNCATNELITGFSQVKVTYDASIRGSSCQPDQIGNAEIQLFDVNDGECAFLVEPLYSNVCVSMFTVDTEQNNAVVAGLPKSKLSNRFVYQPDLFIIGLASFSDTNCTVLGESREIVLELTWLRQNLSKKVSRGGWILNGPKNTQATCADVVMLETQGLDSRKPYLSGYQSEEMWLPFFEPECTPSDATSDPAESDARSLVSSISWVACFGIYLFYSF